MEVGEEVGLAGVGWRDGEKMQTTVIEQQQQKCLFKKKEKKCSGISVMVE